MVAFSYFPCKARDVHHVSHSERRDIELIQAISDGVNIDKINHSSYSLGKSERSRADPLEE